MFVTTTRHAIDRYQQRVRPDLDHPGARSDLDAAIAGAPVLSSEPWPGIQHLAPAAGWVTAHDGEIALPVEYDRSGRAFAVTCLVKGGDPLG